MAGSKIACDLFSMGDGALPRYIDSIEKDLPLPIIMILLNLILDADQTGGRLVLFIYFVYLFCQMSSNYLFH